MAKYLKKFKKENNYRYKERSHGKGHQSRFGKRDDFWNSVTDDSEDFENFIPYNFEKKSQPVPKKDIAPNQYIKDIKGNQIDFARLADIQKVDNTYNGQMTYGIKFVFKGKKGFFKTIWYNRNVNLRDEEYNSYTAYWQEVEGF